MGDFITGDLIICFEMKLRWRITCRWAGFLLWFLSFIKAAILSSFQVWRLEVSEEQKPAFNAILEKHNMDVWGRGKDWIDVLVDPKLRHGVMTSLAAKAIHSSIMIQDVQPYVAYLNLTTVPKYRILHYKNA
jgi:hypothetical protein